MAGTTIKTNKGISKTKKVTTIAATTLLAATMLVTTCIGFTKPNTFATSASATTTNTTTINSQQDFDSRILDTTPNNEVVMWEGTISCADASFSLNKPINYYDIEKATSGTNTIILTVSGSSAETGVRPYKGLERQENARGIKVNCNKIMSKDLEDLIANTIIATINHSIDVKAVELIPFIQQCAENNILPPKDTEYLMDANTIYNIVETTLRNNGFGPDFTIEIIK